MKKFFAFLGVSFAVICAAVSCSKNDPAPEPTVSISVNPKTLSFSADGASQTVEVLSTNDWTASSVPGWLSLDVKSGKGGSSATKVTVTVPENTSSEKSGTIVFSVKGGTSTANLSVTQAASSTPHPELQGKRFLICANSMVYYGGLVQKGGTGSTDQGMLYQLMKANGIDVTVYDCTAGDHYLSDFIGSCKTKPEDGDHLAGIDLSKIDYVVLSQAGSNVASFIDDARAVYKRVTDRNPNAKKIYINHIYAVYKAHNNILLKLKTLHDEDGVTIVNCGQLAYDIYNGVVKVPGGSLSYSDKYTFVNHTSSDTHHPNPLMGYMMTQMLYCAVTGDSASFPGYLDLAKSCKYATGSVTYDEYYAKYYTTAAAHPFMDVMSNATEMAGIQQLIPGYINKYASGGDQPIPGPEPDPDPMPSSIATASDFVNFIRNYAATYTGEMNITADLDLDEMDVVPAADFAGVLNGNGHKISNMILSLPIFLKNSGTIKNIVVDETCGLYPETYMLTNQNFAIFAGTNSGTIEGCSSAANINVEAGNMVITNQIASIVGSNSGEIKSCTNTGRILISPEKISIAIAAGGIVGAAPSGTISGCVNRGNVEVTPDEVSSNLEIKVGGLVANNTKGLFRDCANYGAVVCKVNNSKPRVGGLIGWQAAVDDGSNYNILENCTVNCTVSAGSWESNKTPQWEGGNDVMGSGAMVVGRFSGQSGKSSNLYFGTVEKPVYVGGTIECVHPDHAKSVVLNADNYKSYVCGGGSANNYAGDPSNPVTWQVFNAVYKSDAL